MSSIKLKKSIDEAEKTISEQIQKGEKLYEVGIEMPQKSGFWTQERRFTDNYEDSLRIWKKVTLDKLYDIYYDSDYPNDYFTANLSEDNYVNSTWQPDIQYFLKHDLLPKIDFLKNLLGNIAEFDDTDINSKPQIENQVIETNNKDNMSKENFNLGDVIKSGEYEKLNIGQVIRTIKPHVMITAITILIATSFTAYKLGHGVGQF